MHILELTYPGTTLDNIDANVARKIEPLLFFIEGMFTEATMALNYFEIGYRKLFTPSSRDNVEADKRRKQELTDSMISEHGTDKLDGRQLLEIFEQVELKLWYEVISRMSTPTAYRFCMHGHSYSLWTELESFSTCLAKSPACQMKLTP